MRSRIGFFDKLEQIRNELHFYVCSKQFRLCSCQPRWWGCVLIMNYKLENQRFSC